MDKGSIGCIAVSRRGSGTCIIRDVSDIEITIELESGKTDTLSPAMFHRWWRLTAELAEPKKEEKPFVPAGPQSRVPIVDFSDFVDSITQYAGKLGCEVVPNKRYTAIKYGGKNIAELHIARQKVILVADQHGLAPDILRQGETVPPSFDWVLDTRFTFTDPGGSNHLAKVILEQSQEYQSKKTPTKRWQKGVK